MANIVSTSGIAGWSTTEASNQPDSADSATIQGDLRAIQSAVRYLYSTDTIASASTCDLGSKAAENLTVSGVTTITSLGSTGVAGQLKNVLFSGALTLTHNGTSLILPTGANITTVAGDTAVFLCEGSGNWRCLSYSGKSGQFFSGNFTDTTDSTSSTTGALKTAGGLGVAKKLYVGTDLNVAGNTALGDAATDTTTINSTVVQEYDSATGSQAVWNLRSYQNGNANVGPFMMLSAAKNIKATPQAIGSGEVLGAISFEGYDGSAWSGRQARMYVATTEAWSTTANGCKIIFETTPNASTTMVQRLVLDQGGDVTVSAGNLVIGAADKGIDFSANSSAAGMTSELLNDYEEGTWTATLGDGTNNYSLTAATGKYVKVGKLVTASVEVAWNSIGSAGAGILTLGGLPFGSDSASYYRCAVAIGYCYGVDNQGGKQIFGSMSTNTTTVNFYLVNDNAAPSSLTSNTQNAAGNLGISITYKSNS